MDWSRDGNFLLSTKTASHLYHQYASKMPVVDYHCHLSPEEIRENKSFSTITELWLKHDHYKWRLMRAAGVEERCITGDASDEEKFCAFAGTIGNAIGNPLYHWSHLELSRYFGYDGLLNADTAKDVYALCNERLRDESMRARGLIAASNVRLLCTTDDPADDLHFHEEIANDAFFSVKVLPAWRPDRALHIEKEDFPDYIKQLAKAADTEIRTLSSLKDALVKRMDFFAEKHCTVSDHGLDFVPHRTFSEEAADAVLQKRLRKDAVSEEEVYGFLSVLLRFLGEQYAEKGWVMQLHCGVQRNLNPLLFQTLGADAGGDAIGRRQPPEELAGFLQALQEKDKLPKTILYSLHPTDDVMMETIMGCFQGSGIRGKLQHGSAWWFNDHEQGMREQMSHLASQGMLATFIGMLTDSRSFVSYARHEYFRRILCDLIGGWMETGRFPADTEVAGRFVEDICYNNAVSYFGWRELIDG